jgi:hypothetical protein
MNTLKYMKNLKKNLQPSFILTCNMLRYVSLFSYLQDKHEKQDQKKRTALNEGIPQYDPATKDHHKKPSRTPNRKLIFSKSIFITFLFLNIY